jgi:hypothetical protein
MHRTPVSLGRSPAAKALRVGAAKRGSARTALVCKVSALPNPVARHTKPQRGRGSTCCIAPDGARVVDMRLSSPTHLSFPACGVHRTALGRHCRCRGGTRHWEALGATAMAPKTVRNPGSVTDLVRTGCGGGSTVWAIRLDTSTADIQPYTPEATTPPRPPRLRRDRMTLSTPPQRKHSATYVAAPCSITTTHAGNECLGSHGRSFVLGCRSAAAHCAGVGVGVGTPEGLPVVSADCHGRGLSRGEQTSGADGFTSASPGFHVAYWRATGGSCCSRVAPHPIHHRRAAQCAPPNSCARVTSRRPVALRQADTAGVIR